jgi:hypothetical protein
VESAVGAAAEVGIFPSGSSSVTAMEPAFGGPLVDAVPIGTLGCGEAGDVDALGRARPADGDGDGTAACDVGAFELQP